MSDTANEQPAPAGPAPEEAAGGTAGADSEAGESSARKRRRRGSRGGRGRSRTGGDGDGGPASAGAPDGSASGSGGTDPDELPDPPREGRPSPDVAGAATTPYQPKIGDTRPAPPPPPRRSTPPTGVPAAGAPAAGRGRAEDEAGDGGAEDGGGRKRRRRGGRGRSATARPAPPEAPVEVDAEALERRRGRERKGRPVGRYLMCVNVRQHATQVAVLEGRALIEHYVSRPQDDALQIDGNIYLGKVQNVLPGMEAAFVDIGTPKNAVLYRGDVQYDPEDVEEKGQVRIEHVLRQGQTILCQVTKNPIGTKGARLTQEVSIPGRFVVLVPNSSTYGISKRLGDEERKRLRKILDEIRPEQHGLIVRTAAEGVSAEELRRDLLRLLAEWAQIEAKAKRVKAPALLYCEPPLAVRVIREEFNRDYRGVVIDDRELYEEVRAYVGSINPELLDRVELFDPDVEPLPIFERFHVHEQLHKALDRKVWLPSGGSLIIERTEALTVIDVNTGKNVGTSNLEETVFRNNLEAAEEVARQLRLRDIGGIIVIDFIDMEILSNRQRVIDAFRAALARDKTKTQVFDISELGLVEMTRKRISEGLVESFSAVCPSCNGRGIVLDETLL